MFRRFHGVDRHKSYSTISVLNRDGEEVRFLRACSIEEHVKNLVPEDAVVLEASCGSFYWAGRIEAAGAACFVLDANRFRIITDSWNKTDKQDARNLAKALWMFLVTGEFGIPTVYKPSETIRTLRRLFAAYNLLNRQIRMLKNAIQATVEIQVAQLCQTTELKERMATQIMAASAPLAKQIELLVTIPGITALTAAAFLADVGDVTRFGSRRQMSAYLGSVPRCHDSGGTSRPGHISRKSRKLTRTMLTQSIYQTIKGTPSWQRLYDKIKERRGSGRAKIAMIRRLCGVMRRMLLEGEQFHWLKEELYQRKLRQYRAALENDQREQDAA